MREPSFTCPKIDKNIQNLSNEISSIIDNLQNLKTDDNEDHVYSLTDQLQYLAKSIEQAFEDVRTSNIEIRNWGEYWQEACKRYSEM